MIRDLGLLLLRVTVGSMLLGHGVGKMADLFSGSREFPDPLGIGPTFSLILAGFAEFVCSLFVILGIKTRLSAIPIVITMLVAGLVVQRGDPWGEKELAFLYAAAFLTLVLTGGGRFGLDSLIGKLWKFGS